MNLKDMTDLVMAYDGVKEVENAIGILTSSCVGTTYEKGECAVGKLAYIWDVIMRNSKLYQKKEDDKDFDMMFHTLFSVVNDKTMTAEERARIVLTLE